MSPFRPAKLTPEQSRALDVARVAFMTQCPFYANLMHSIGREVITRDIPTAATDGRHIVLNPDYFCKLSVGEQVFVLAHEMDHLLCRHPQRFAHYKKAGKIKGKDADQIHANVSMDWVINANLVETKVGRINPAWLYDPKIKGSELWEDVYARTYQKPPQQPPPPPQGGQPGKPCPQGQPNKTAGTAGKAPRDLRPDANVNADGSFDELLPPPVDPVTGQPDLPDAAEFAEAVARASAVAKAMGSMPAYLQSKVNELLEPQVDWRDHIRLLMTGHIGTDRTTWTKLNRRRLALDPIVVMPGKRGFGCDTVVVGVDTSGSIGTKELQVFLSEVGGILNDTKPKRIIVIGCDAAVTQTEEVSTLDELDELRRKGVKGGGGTSFIPVFDYCEKENIKPECLVYLTDMMGRFPSKAPGYPVVWAATTDYEAPWGDLVRIKIS